MENGTATNSAETDALPAIMENVNAVPPDTPNTPPPAIDPSETHTILSSATTIAVKNTDPMNHHHRQSNRRRRRSSNNNMSMSGRFRQARMSFFRSNGTRGATVATLRGTRGADFEAAGRIVRISGAVQGEEGDRCCFAVSSLLLCRCCTTTSDSNIFYLKDRRECWILIKGPFLFVFAGATNLDDASQTTPQYAVSLHSLRARVVDESLSLRKIIEGGGGGGSAGDGGAGASGDNTKTTKTTTTNISDYNRGLIPLDPFIYKVLLQDSLGDGQYELFFASEAVAQAFTSTVDAQSASAQAAEVRKRLGHAHLLSQRASIQFAETIALKKVDDQPDAPISAEELVSNMPYTGI